MKISRSTRIQLLLLALLILIPAGTVLAQSSIPREPKNFKDFACIVIKLVMDFIPLIMVFAIGDWIMGLIKYVAHGDDEQKRNEGRKMMIYGVIGFFFMVSIWGILRIFGAGLGVSLVIPQFKSTGGFSCSNSALINNAGF